MRPLRTDLSVQPFTARQRETYLGAIRMFRDEFDWIGFLDADEYLYLRGGADLPGFLSGFPQAAAIAFSWCIYGSNGHLLKPLAPTVEAFTRHSPAEFGHNRSVKSFVRPQFVVDRWRDPHTFNVGGKPYLDPSGQPVRWGGPGAINHPPDWSVAKLMHFIPRSMEHFIERIRRRSDLQGLTNEYWNVFNVNEIEDREPLRLLPLLYRNLFRINNEIMRDYLGTRGPCHAGAPAPFAAQAQTCFGGVLAIDGLGQLVHGSLATLSKAGCRRVILVGASAHSQALYMLAPDSDDAIHIKNDHRICNVLGFEQSAAPDGGSVTLKTPMRRYLTALPPDGTGIGVTSADRWEPKEWERFVLVPTEAPEDLEPRYAGLGLLPAAPPSPATVRDIIKAGGAIGICAAAMQFLPNEQRALANPDGATLLPGWM